jgi:hypothetical protein
MADNSSRSEVVLVVTTTTFVLASVFVTARLISRFGILKSRTADDWFMIVAWVSDWVSMARRDCADQVATQFIAFGLSFSINYGTSKGLGKHDADIPAAWLPALRRSEYAFTILYVRLPDTIGNISS